MQDDGDSREPCKVAQETLRIEQGKDAVEVYSSSAMIKITLTKMTSPIQLSLKYLRRIGYECAVTEHWNPFAKVRQDMFGFSDILAFGHDVFVLVQTTTRSNLSARIKKIKGLAVADFWIRNGGRIEVHGWKKSGREWSVKVVKI